MSAPTLDFETLLAELVATPSVSSADPALDMGNSAAVACLANPLADAGFECDLLAVGGRPEKKNLIARIGGDSDEGLVLAGHLDTVPFDESGWDSYPFKLSKRDDRYYGLGTSDMKGFLALAAEVAGEYTGHRLQQPLVILASAEEECGMDGARQLADEEPRPGRHVLIGEPTGLRPIRQHKGILMEAIRVTGRAGHSSNPALGINSIEGMQAVLTAVLAFRDELRERATASGFPVPHATLNPGTIRGGDNPNRIPASCELQVDLRFPPGFDIATLREELRQRAREALAGSDCRIEFRALFEGTPAMDTPAEAPLVTAAEELTGAPARAVDFGTEGPFYNRMGMESVILGPGDIECAHQPNEYLPLDRIEPMRRILHSLIERFCLPD